MMPTKIMRFPWQFSLLHLCFWANSISSSLRRVLIRLRCELQFEIALSFANDRIFDIGRQGSRVLSEQHMLFKPSAFEISQLSTYIVNGTSLTVIRTSDQVLRHWGVLETFAYQLRPIINEK